MYKKIKCFCGGGFTLLCPPSMTNKWFHARNAQQNSFGYNFAFMMLPVQAHNPKTAYCLLGENIVIALYYPFVFVRRCKIPKINRPKRSH